MINFPEINPVALDLKVIAIRWYGLMYLFGFAGGYLYLLKTSHKISKKFNKENVIDLIFYIAIGVLVGGRVGYILFYEPDKLINEPVSLIRFWEPGRSFHAGFIGVLIAIYFYAKNNKLKFLQVTDFVAPAVPIGIAFGRLGNFINAELWGRPTDMPWGVIFPYSGNVSRHPSQIYEMLLEGILLFIILAAYNQKSKKLGFMSGLFCLLYGFFRFFSEFYREPDAFIGFVWLDWITMGQVLSIPMIIIGAWLMLLKINKGKRS